MSIARTAAGYVASGVGAVAETGKAVVVQIFTFDRMEQKLANGGLDAQIRQRARRILSALFAACVSAIFVAYGVVTCMQNLNVINGLTLAASALSALVSVKEAILQMIAREKEKALYLKQLAEGAHNPLT